MIKNLESQEAEEGGSVTLHCELSQPGLPVEWKKGTQVLSSGEKYKMKQSECDYKLQIFYLTPGDTGSYSCLSEDTISSASLAVKGRVETTSSSHALFSVLKFLNFLFILHCTSSLPFLTLNCDLSFIHQLPQLYLQKSWKA